MDERKKQIQDLAKKLIQLTEDTENEWYQKEELTNTDIEEIQNLGKRTDYIGTIVKMLWFLLKNNQELKDRLTELELKIKSNDITVPWNPNPWPGTEPIQPYTPYIPYPSTPSAPNPWQVWYGSPTYSSPGTGDLFGPVTCTYTDTEGHKFDIDPTIPAILTCTYQVGNNRGCGHSYSVQSNSNPLEQ